MKTTKVQDRETATLQSQLGTLQSQYNERQIAFENSKGQARSLPFNRIDRNGAFVGDRETETAEWDTYIAIGFRAQFEQKRAVNKGANLALRAGYSAKSDLGSVSVRTSRMPGKECKVTGQLAQAQRMAREIREIEGELAARTEAARVKAEQEAKAKADAELLAAMTAPVAAAA